MAKLKVVVTGAAGFLAGRMLPTFRERYDLTLLDVRTTNRDGAEVEGVVVCDLLEPNRDAYRSHFAGADVVMHCGFTRARIVEEPVTEAPGDGGGDIRFQGRSANRGGDARFESEMNNIRMCYNVYQTCVEEGVRRAVVLSSNHASDYYEVLIWNKQMGALVTPDMPARSDNFYGWAKGAYESLGFTYSTGTVSGGKPLEMIQIRIGGPRENDAENFSPDRPEQMHRGLGCYLSARDQVQLIVKSIETPDITNDLGVPFQIFYGISNNTQKFWDLSNARRVIGYEPEDDSSVKFGESVGEVLKAGQEGKYGRQ